MPRILPCSRICSGIEAKETLTLAQIVESIADLDALYSYAMFRSTPARVPVARHRSASAPTRQQAAPSKAAPRLPDAQLESAIRAKFAKSKINADKFQVHVQGGVATIEGRTDVIQHKGVATRLARRPGQW